MGDLCRHRGEIRQQAQREAKFATIDGMEKRFQEPGWLTKNVFNRLVALLTRTGISVAGSRVLEVRGRKSGEWRRTPVNLLVHDGDRYLVAPRGETQWVRNMRVAGGGRLVLGGKAEEFRATEVGEGEKPELLRAYLEKWKWEVGAFFDGVGPDASEEELRRIGPGHPAFKID
jgi:deazaflavin-dependent oxidoreductase (nitroreductase family)